MRKKSLRSISAILGASTLVMGMGFSQPIQASTPLIAEIVMFGGNFAPRSWAFCDGQLLPIAQNTALFSILGTTYGGDGRTTFGLPDMRGRTAIGPRTGPGLSPYALGQKGGAEQVTLTVNQMPAHTHTATATAHATSTGGNDSSPANNVMAVKNRTNIYSNAAPNVTMSPAAVTVSNANAGGNQAHENRMPYLAINHIIAIVGTFPSRN